MDKNTKAALTIYSGVSFQVSLDDIVDFANGLKIPNHEFCYQEFMYTSKATIDQILPSTTSWLTTHYPDFKAVTEKVLALPSKEDRVQFITNLTKEESHV